MKLEAIVLRHVALELREPLVAAWGTERQRQVVIVEALAGGLRGYGEVPVLSAPFYQPETPETAWHVLRDFLIPLALRETWSDPAELAQLLQRVRGHAMARAGLESAVWDLLARQQGLSLAALMGGERSFVPAGATLGLHADERLLVRQALALRKAGYRRIKLKIAPGRDRRPLSALRRALGSETDLAADANGSYTPGAAQGLAELDSLELAFVEQPLAPRQLTEHAALQARLKTPICLDESIENAGDADAALVLKACRLINIKPARVGGLVEAMRIHDRAVARETPVWCGGMLETGIGQAHALALASLPGFALPSDLGPSDRYWQRDLIDPPLSLDAAGTLPVPGGPGSGVTVDRAFLARATLRRSTHLAPGGA